MQTTDPRVTLPPQNIEIEQQVIGGIISNPQSIERVIPYLEQKSFYSISNQAIYQACLQNYTTGVPIDLNTVAATLRSLGKLDVAGGALNLHEIVRDVLDTVNIDYYAKLIQSHYLRRQLIQACERIREQAFDTSSTLDELFSCAENEVFTLSQARIDDKRDPELLRKVVERELSELNEAMEIGKSALSYQTGYHELDDQVVSFVPGSLVVIAGRPAQGKTALAINLIWNWSQKYDGMVIPFFSLEMEREQIARRFLSLTTQTRQDKIQKLQLTESDLSKLGSSVQLFNGNNVIIDDTPNMKIDQVVSRCRQLGSRAKLGPIIIDYVQLMSEDDDNKELTRISRASKQLARQTGAPVIILSQLSRSVENRTNKRPMMSDLRGSGSFEQDASLVLTVYRDEYYNPDTEDKGICEIGIVKQRNGPTGISKLLFEGSTGEFLNIRKPGDFKW